MARVAFALLMALALAAPLAASAYETEEGVIVGTDETLDEIVADNEFVLVEFYAPWCGHCKSLAPEYAQAAQELESKGSPVKLVKVDATIHSKSAERFGVQGYPTLKWFTNGEASDFGGGRTASEIVNWINKKSGPPAVDVDDVDAAKALAEENDVVVLGVFDDKESDDAKIFLAAAADTDLPFGISTSADVAKEFGITAPGVIVLKDFDNGNTVYDGDMDADDISAFALAESLPLVVEFNDQNAPKIFGGEVKTHLLLFAKESDENTQAARDAMAEAAADFKGSILFIYMNSEKEEHERIMDFFGIQSSEIPTMRLIALEDNMAKYKPDFSDITAANIKGFAKKFVAGELERHLMSEETPEDWDAEPVKVLTGNNFKSVALAEDKAVLVEFYAPWCGHCKSLAPIYDKLGAAFEGADEVVIAKMDSTANEVAGVTVESFPTIKFFPKGVTSAEGAVDYEGARTLKAMADFLTEKTGVATEVADDAGEDAEEGGDDYGEEPEYEEDAEEGHDEL